MNQVMKQNYPIIVDGYADYTMAGKDEKQYNMEALVEFYVDCVLDILNYVSQY
jgi:hypothetical protein